MNQSSSGRKGEKNGPKKIFSSCFQHDCTSTRSSDIFLESKTPHSSIVLTSSTVLLISLGTPRSKSHFIKTHN